MRQLKRKKRNKVIGGVLALFLFIFATAPSLQAKTACDEALGKCTIDALITLIFGGPHVFVLYSSACLMFYDWCKRYYL